MDSRHMSVQLLTCCMNHSYICGEGQLGVCVCIEEKLCVWSTDAWSSLTCAGRSTGDVVNQSLMDEMKCGRAKVQGKLRAGAAE